MLAAVESIRALTYYSAYLYDTKSPEFMLMSHVTKLHAARLAVDVTRRAVQMEGGFGYSKESKAEMFYRDAKILEIGEGHQRDNEIRHLSLHREKPLMPFRSQILHILVSDRRRRHRPLCGVFRNCGTRRGGVLPIPRRASPPQ